MSKPAGVQLRRWFTYMVILLLFVNVAAVTLSIVVFTSVRSVTARYQPFALAAKEVEKEILSAQRDMFEYLSELADDPSKAVGHLEKLKEGIARATELSPSDATTQELSDIAALTDKYRITIEQLPMMLEGSRDWSRVEEIRATAIRYGGEVSSRAGALARMSHEEIQKRNSRALGVTTFAMWTFVLVMGLSVVVLLALKHWWKRFQDLILGI